MGSRLLIVFSVVLVSCAVWKEWKLYALRQPSIIITQKMIDDVKAIGDTHVITCDVRNKPYDLLEEWPHLTLRDLPSGLL